jgi:hypothetical protein
VQTCNGYCHNNFTLVVGIACEDSQFLATFAKLRKSDYLFRHVCPSVSLPACLPACLPVCLPACLPAGAFPPFSDAVHILI